VTSPAITSVTTITTAEILKNTLIATHFGSRHHQHNLSPSQLFAVVAAGDGERMSTIPFAQRLSCTIDEACQATGLGRTKLYEEMSAGRVQTTNVGKRRLILVPSLLRRLDPTVSGKQATGEISGAASDSATSRMANSDDGRGERPNSPVT
jgi:hypothetical protein